MCFGCGDINHKEEEKIVGITEAGEKWLKENPKVFCDQCKHFVGLDIYDGDTLREKCHHPKILNHSSKKSDTAITKEHVVTWKYPGDCRALNTYNNCELFQQKIDRG